EPTALLGRLVVADQAAGEVEHSAVHDAAAVAPTGDGVAGEVGAVPRHVGAHGRERPVVVDPAARVVGVVAAHHAVGDGQDAAGAVDDAAADAHRVVAVVEERLGVGRERPADVPHLADLVVRRVGAVVDDLAVGDGEAALVADAAAVGEGAVAGDHEV